MAEPRPSSTTVGIVAYRRPAALRRLLTTLSGHAYDIVVVNVGRDPGVAQVVAAAAEGRLVEVDNRGYAAAVNSMVAQARGDVVVFTNDDVDVTPGAIDELAEIVRAGDAEVAVPRIVNAVGDDEGTILALPTPGRLLLEWALLPDHATGFPWSAHGVEKGRRPQRVEQVDACTAVTVAARTELLRDTPLPEDYFLYWEELDWFWRLREQRHRVVLVPTATVVHEGGRDDVRPEKSRLMARNAVRCVRRTQGRAAAVAALFVVILWNLRLVTVDTVRAMASPNVSRRARVHARWAGLAAAAGSWREVR